MVFASDTTARTNHEQLTKEMSTAAPRLRRRGKVPIKAKASPKRRGNLELEELGLVPRGLEAV